MSSLSLEERRAERRRRREMEAESLLTKSPEEIEADIQERLAQRRKEREERMAALSSSYATVNGEDDLERRRRERREARLREKTDTSTDDTYSYRSRRRDSDEPSEDSYSSYSSYRSRRRRNWDEEDTETVSETPSLPDTSAEEESSAERRRRQREEEEEEARLQQEKEEEEERQRQAEQSERRRQEEEDRRRAEEEEEERRRQEEEENEKRRKEVEEERRRQEILRAVEDEQFSDVSEDNSINGDDKKPDNKLFIDEDALKDADVNILNTRVGVSDKLDRVRKWNEESNYSGIKGSSANTTTYRNSVTVKLGAAVDSLKDIKRNSGDLDKYDNGKSDRGLGRSSSFKEINNNKIKDKLEKFEHLKKEESVTKKSSTSVAVTRIEKSSPEGDGLKGKLKKFEREIKEQTIPIVKADPPKKQLPGYTTPAQKLSDKLQHFETAARSQNTAKTSSRNIQFELEKSGSKRNQRQSLLGRWSVSESHIHKSPPVKETPSKKVLERWKSVDKQDQKPNKVLTNGDDQSKKRLSGGNIQFKTAMYLEKASKSIDENPTGMLPKSPGALRKQSFERRTSQSSGNQSDISETLLPNQSRSRVTDRWQFGEAKPDATKNEMIVHSRGSSMDNSYIHSRGSSMDASSERSWRNSYNDQEEEERLEQARLEKERMAEESKKRGKKKGLGGLTPEKKKKLKQIIMQKAAEDLKTEALAKAKEKEAFVNKKLPPLEISGMAEAELKKLCKMLHENLLQIHSEVYDWEYKVGKQEQEVTELTMKVNDSRGKFVKPVLRKVNKTTN